MGYSSILELIFPNEADYKLTIPQQPWGRGLGANNDQRWETAELFRMRAKELRVIAEETGDRASRKALHEVADNYERLAREREAASGR